MKNELENVLQPANQSKINNIAEEIKNAFKPMLQKIELEQMKHDLHILKLENIYLKSELDLLWILVKNNNK
jgi:hypothetical protein